ncbi:hypothetical protein LNP17_17770 [Klebsiella variicola subsp. variicola]|nr:hypothetical protein [Klebsiella variicola subsp. variicola]
MKKHNLNAVGPASAFSQNSLSDSLVAVAVVLLWRGAVSYFRIPAFLVPSPLVMLESLWTHLTPLSCWRCCSPSRSPLDLVSAVDCHLAPRWRLSWCRTALWKPPCFRISCFLQVTPIVAIAPLDHHLGEGCHALAGGVRHPDGGVSHHLQYHSGLRSVSPAC